MVTLALVAATHIVAPVSATSAVHGLCVLGRTPLRFGNLDRNARKGW
jgi:hypothetical protein